MVNGTDHEAANVKLMASILQFGIDKGAVDIHHQLRYHNVSCRLLLFHTELFHKTAKQQPQEPKSSGSFKGS